MARVSKKRLKYNYTEKMEIVKPYVSFNFEHPEKLGRKNKIKITKYFETITNLLLQNPKIVTLKKKREFKAAQKSINKDLMDELPELKKIFLPPSAPPSSKIKFKYKKSKSGKSTKIPESAFIQHDFGQEETFWLDQEALADDPENEVRRALKNSGYKRFKIKAGEWQMHDSFSSIDALIREIEKLMNAYSIGGKDNTLTQQYHTEKQVENHKWENWLVGIDGLKTLRQSKPSKKGK